MPGGKRILVIDDDRDFLESMQAMLLYNGYDAEAASDGAQGVAMYKKYLPDIVLLDIRMPKVDGYRVFELLRRADPDARIVLISSYDLDDEKFGAMREESAHTDILDKPIQLAGLRRMVKKHAK